MSDEYDDMTYKFFSMGITYHSLIKTPKVIVMEKKEMGRMENGKMMRIV